MSDSQDFDPRYEAMGAVMLNIRGLDKWIDGGREQRD
jgi:hypothetical protein